MRNNPTVKEGQQNLLKQDTRTILMPINNNNDNRVTNNNNNNNSDISWWYDNVDNGKKLVKKVNVDSDVRLLSQEYGYKKSVLNWNLKTMATMP